MLHKTNYVPEKTGQAIASAAWQSAFSHWKLRLLQSFLPRKGGFDIVCVTSGINSKRNETDMAEQFKYTQVYAVPACCLNYLVLKGLNQTTEYINR